MGVFHAFEEEGEKDADSMLQFIKLAWRNMWRNWRRTLIATVAIVLSMILLNFIIGFKVTIGLCGIMVIFIEEGNL